MTPLTPEEINAQLLGRVLELERELAEMQARASMGRPDLPPGEDIRRIRTAAHEALVARSVGLEGEAAAKAMAIAGDFLQLRPFHIVERGEGRRFRVPIRHLVSSRIADPIEPRHPGKAAAGWQPPSPSADRVPWPRPCKASTSVRERPQIALSAGIARQLLRGGQLHEGADAGP